MKWVLVILLQVTVLQVTMLQAATIVLDPGHGGKYVGTSNKTYHLVEKNLSLEIAQQLAERLRSKKHTVILTRETDTELDKDDLIADLTKRAQMSTGADLFVSLHFNGSESKHREGFEVYVPYEAQYPIKSYALASALHYDMSHEIEPYFHGGTLGNLNFRDGGIRASRFNILKKATCPAVLVELAFLSHYETAKKLTTDEYKGSLVTAVYKGIERYLTHESQKASRCSRPRCRRWQKGKANLIQHQP